jgi:hypothetical protein
LDKSNKEVQRISPKLQLVPENRELFDDMKEKRYDIKDVNTPNSQLQLINTSYRSFFQSPYNSTIKQKLSSRLKKRPDLESLVLRLDKKKIF